VNTTLDRVGTAGSAGSIGTPLFNRPNLKTEFTRPEIPARVRRGQRGLLPITPTAKLETMPTRLERL
jgi:hypothetical protein